MKRIMIILIALCMLCGCETSGSFCAIYEPVYYSVKEDSKETIKAIIRNNIVYNEMCK